MSGGAGDLGFTPVIILGAGRSGTNMLRDVLTALPDMATWPCDEIQPIWRHGHFNHPTDAFTVEMARAPVRDFIRRAFVRQWRARGRPRFLVEKTCASTLRLPFIHRVLPEARYVLITRHPEDVVPSAVARWEGKLDVPPLPYFAAKARFIPPSDVPRYGWRFVANRLDKARGKSRRLKVWGPIWDELETHQSAPLDEICARQWLACAHATRMDAAWLGVPLITTSYERFLGDPEAELRLILGALGHDLPAAELTTATGPVRRKTIPLSPRTGLGQSVKELLAPEARAYGYKVL